MSAHARDRLRGHRWPGGAKVYGKMSEKSHARLVDAWLSAVFRLWLSVPHMASHTERLLTIAEEIVRLKAEISRLSNELEMKRAEFEHVLAGGSRAVDQTTLEAQIALGQAIEAAEVTEAADNRVTRILDLMNRVGASTATMIALDLHEDQKKIYSTMMDMKRRHDWLAGPEAGVWTITARGMREHERRAKHRSGRTEVNR